MGALRETLKFFGNPIPAAIYLFGSASFMATDFLIASTASAEDVASWAEARAFFGILVVVALLGLDSMFIRYPQGSALLVKRVGFQVPLMAGLSSAALLIAGLNERWLLTAMLIIGGALSVASQECLRSNGNTVGAQLANQAWRVPLFVMVGGYFLFGVDVDLLQLFSVVVFINGVVFYFFLRNRYRNDSVILEELSTSEVYVRSSRFLISSLTLAAAVHVEQIVVIHGVDAPASAAYFQHTVYFIFPLLFFYSYVGFMLVPYIRRNRIHMNLLIGLVGRYLLPGAIATSAALSYFSSILFEAGIGPEVSLDRSLQFIFFLTGIWLGLYTIPSAYNALFLSGAHHTSFVLAQALALLAGAAIGVISKEMGSTTLNAIAIASSAGWLLRTLVGFYFSVEIARNLVRDQD